MIVNCFVANLMQIKGGRRLRRIASTGPELSTHCRLWPRRQVDVDQTRWYSWPSFRSAYGVIAELAPCLLAFAALLEPVPLGIAAGLFAGKTIGVFGAAAAAIWLGLARMPGGAGWASLLGVAMLCGIGFTMSLFISGLAFEAAGREFIVQTRLGILGGSLISALSGYTLLRLALRQRAVGPAAQ